MIAPAGGGGLHVGCRRRRQQHQTQKSTINNQAELVMLYVLSGIYRITRWVPGTDVFLRAPGSGEKKLGGEEAGMSQPGDGPHDRHREA